MNLTSAAMERICILGWIVIFLTWSCSDFKQEKIEKVQEPEKAVEHTTSWAWEELKSPTKEHIRGLCVVSDRLVW